MGLQHTLNSQACTSMQLKAGTPETGVWKAGGKVDLHQVHGVHVC